MLLFLDLKTCSDFNKDPSGPIEYMYVPDRNYCGNYTFCFDSTYRSCDDGKIFQPGSTVVEWPASPCVDAASLTCHLNP